MRDITSPKLLYAKGALLLACGVLAGAALLADRPSVKTAVLLAITVWGFARAYYFAFYVVERYVDPAYRFAGLTSFAGYLLRRRRAGRPGSASPPPGRAAGGRDGGVIRSRPEERADAAGRPEAGPVRREV